MHIPTLKFNVLSINILSKTSKVKFIFYALRFTWPSEWRDFGYRESFGRLYILDNSSSSFSNDNNEETSHLLCHSTLKDNYSRILQHNRLGHAPYHVLHNLNLCREDLHISTSPCDICSISKQHKLPVPISSSRSSKIFDLIHVDLLGPYKQAFLTGGHYILTIYWWF